MHRIVLLFAIGFTVLGSAASANADEPICYAKLPSGEIRDLTKFCQRPKPTTNASNTPLKCEFGEVQTAQGIACLPKEQGVPPSSETAPLQQADPTMNTPSTR